MKFSRFTDERISDVVEEGYSDIAPSGNYFLIANMYLYIYMCTNVYLGSKSAKSRKK